MIDVNKFTMAEVAKVEQLSGSSITRLTDDDAPKGLVMAALAFVQKKRDNMRLGNPPGAFTWDDALDLTMDEVNVILELDDDEPEAVAEPRENEVNVVREDDAPAYTVYPAPPVQSYPEPVARPLPGVTPPPRAAVVVNDQTMTV